MIRTNTTQLRDLKIVDLQMRTHQDKVNSCDVKSDTEELWYAAKLIIPNKTGLNEPELRKNGYTNMTQNEYQMLDEMKDN
jgi:hypothetical protein